MQYISSTKGLYPEYIKNSYIPIRIKTSRNTSRNLGKEIEHFTKEDYQNGQEVRENVFNLIKHQRNKN